MTRLFDTIWMILEFVLHHLPHILWPLSMLVPRIVIHPKLSIPAASPTTLKTLKTVEQLAVHPGHLVCVYLGDEILPNYMGIISKAILRIPDPY